MVCVRRVAVLGDLDHVKPKLRLNVGLWVLLIRDGWPIFSFQFGEFLRDGLIDEGMAGDVRGIVRQCPQGKRIFIDVSLLFKQGSNKIAAAYIMDQITKEPVSEWV